VSRDVLASIAVLALSAMALALPGTAQADVLEVSGSQSVWIAGGPAPSVSYVAAAPGNLASEIPSENSAFTWIADAAGPAQWRGRVAELAAKYDISPALLEALVWQESRWNPHAVSPAGARGLAQLMPGTARVMGIDSHNPSANLEGGARYLRAQLDTFDGNLEKALAAYNAGPGRVERAGGIPQIAETQNYVAAILSRLAQPVRR
jgi:soluble lytic murein transglycosylase-like protein